MDPVLQPLGGILSLNTDLVLNSVADLSEADALRRPVPNGNNVRFLLAHLVAARHFVAELLGKPLANPHEEAFRAVETVEHAESLPELSALRREWSRISPHVVSCLERATADVLTSSAPQPLPGSDGTVLGAITFLVQHESYHLGQLGLLRIALGYPGVSYDPAPGRSSPWRPSSSTPSPSGPEDSWEPWPGAGSAGSCTGRCRWR